MEIAQFEAQLKADGFQEIESKDLSPKPAQGKHRHLFEVRGMVISGEFTVVQPGGPVVYGPGDIYSVPEGELHDEAIGPEGCASRVRKEIFRSRVGKPIMNVAANRGGLYSVSLKISSPL